MLCNLVKLNRRCLKVNSWYDLLLTLLSGSCFSGILLFKYPNQSSVEWPICRVCTFSCAKNNVDNFDQRRSLSLRNLKSNVTYMYLSSRICPWNFRSLCSAFILTTSASRWFCCDIFIRLWKSSFGMRISHARLSPPTPVDVSLWRVFKLMDLILNSCELSIWGWCCRNYGLIWKPTYVPSSSSTFHYPDRASVSSLRV